MVRCGVWVQLAALLVGIATLVVAVVGLRYAVDKLDTANNIAAGIFTIELMDSAIRDCAESSKTFSRSSFRLTLDSALNHLRQGEYDEIDKDRDRLRNQLPVPCKDFIEKTKIGEPVT